MDATGNHDLNEAARMEVDGVAMLVLMVSLGMLFATLLLACVLYRSSSPQWPPATSGGVGPLLPNCATLAIAAASAALWAFQRAWARGGGGRGASGPPPSPRGAPSWGSRPSCGGSSGRRASSPARTSSPPSCTP